jgi:P27 family predicted phage terminase small subunit
LNTRFFFVSEISRPKKESETMANIKPVSLKAGAITKAEKQKRLEAEQKLRGGADKLKPPSRLNPNQRKIFKFIVNELEASGILGNLDIYILETCVIAIDRIQEIEKAINEDREKLFDKNVISTKNKYTQDFFRSMDHLSLSPSSRAKLGVINLHAKEKESDPLLEALGLIPSKEVKK